MKEMVINFEDDGSIEHTLKDSFLNPAEGQERDIQRMTTILHDKALQKFYCEFLMGPFAGRRLTEVMFNDVKGCLLSMAYNRTVAPSPVIYYDKYEDAVEAEISIINEMRGLGVKIKND